MKTNELITLLSNPGTKLILEAALTSYMELVGMLRDEIIDLATEPEEADPVPEIVEPETPSEPEPEPLPVATKTEKPKTKLVTCKQCGKDFEVDTKIRRILYCPKCKDAVKRDPEKKREYDKRYKERKAAAAKKLEEAPELVDTNKKVVTKEEFRERLMKEEEARKRLMKEVEARKRLMKEVEARKRLMKEEDGV